MVRYLKKLAMGLLYMLLWLMASFFIFAAIALAWPDSVEIDGIKWAIGVIVFFLVWMVVYSGKVDRFLLDKKNVAALQELEGGRLKFLICLPDFYTEIFASFTWIVVFVFVILMKARGENVLAGGLREQLISGLVLALAGELVFALMDIVCWLLTFRSVLERKRTTGVPAKKD